MTSISSGGTDPFAIGFIGFVDDKLEFILNTKDDAQKIFEGLCDDFKIIDAATNPGNIKKFSKIFRESVKIANFYTGAVILPGTVSVLKLVGDCVDFYNFYRLGKFWISYFNPTFANGGKINQKALKKNLTRELIKQGVGVQGSADLQKLVEEIITDIMNPPLKAGQKKAPVLKSKEAVKERIGLVLKSKAIDPELAKNISDNVRVKLRSKSPKLVAAGFAFLTVADAGDLFFTLKRWGLFDLSKIGAKIGTKFPIFLHVTQASVEGLLAKINIIGCAILITHQGYTFIKTIQTYRNAADEDQKATIKKDLQKQGIKLLVSTIQITCTIAPVVFPLSIPAVAACAIVSNTTALVVVLCLSK